MWSSSSLTLFIFLWLAVADLFTRPSQIVSLADLCNDHRLKGSISLVITRSRNTWPPWRAQFYRGSSVPSP